MRPGRHHLVDQTRHVPQRKRRFLKLVGVILGGSTLIVGAFIAFVIFSEAPFVPDLDDLEPLPEELRLVDSFLAIPHGGGRVPAEVNLVVEPKSPPPDEGQEALARLREHLSARGWSETKKNEWGFESFRTGGPILEYGLLDDYIKQVEEDGTEIFHGTDRMAFLRQHQAPGRLLIVAF